jgi:hypothetical protein
MATANTTHEAEWRELREVLDDEVARLPDRYREPFVLCCVQGQPTAQVARQLGCPEGTLFSWLARARERLRVRLERRGIALSTAALATLLSAERLSAAVPPGLAGATGKTAALMALCVGLADASPITELAKGVLQEMFRNRLRRVAIRVLLVALALTAGTWALHTALAAKAPIAEAPAPAEQPAPAPVKNEGGPVPAGPITTPAGIFGMAISPDGKLFATGGEDKVLRLWDIKTGKLVREWPTPEGPVSFLKFSPDGKSLGGNAFGYHFWNVETGKKFPAPANVGGVLEFAFAPDSKTAAISSDGGIRLVEIATGKERPRFILPKEKEKGQFAPYPLAFSPDGKTLASGGLHRVLMNGALQGIPAPIRLWDLETGKLSRELDSPAKHLVFTANGKSLISYTPLQRRGAGPTAAFGQDMVLWDLATFKESRRLTFGELFCLSSDGKTPVEMHADPENAGRFLLWVYPDITMNDKLRAVRAIEAGENHPVIGTFMAPNKKYLAFMGIVPKPGSRAHYECVRFWDLAEGKEIAKPVR